MTFGLMQVNFLFSVEFIDRRTVLGGSVITVITSAVRLFIMTKLSNALS